MPFRSASATPLHERSTHDLQVLVDACERALLRGTSSHADLELLIAAERELRQRAERRARPSARGPRPTGGTHASLGSRSGSGTGDDGTLDL